MNFAQLDAKSNAHRQLGSGNVSDALNPSRGIRFVHVVNYIIELLLVIAMKSSAKAACLEIITKTT
jgi:hypothetical protein